MSENEVAKALHDGLDTLRLRGLAKGRLWNEQGQVCARGALCGGIAGRYIWNHAADALLSEVATEQYPDRVEPVRITDAPIVAFNNHPDTTQEDVERVFEKAIVRSYEMEAGE